MNFYRSVQKSKKWFEGSLQKSDNVLSEFRAVQGYSHQLSPCVCLPESKLSHECALAALANTWQLTEHSVCLVQMEAEWLYLTCWVSLQCGYCTVVVTYLLVIEIKCCSGLTVLGLINLKLRPVIWYTNLRGHRSYPCPFFLVLVTGSSPVLLWGCPSAVPQRKGFQDCLPWIERKHAAWLYELLKCSL